MEAAGSTSMPVLTLAMPLTRRPPPPRIHIRPWWFPVEELRRPIVFYLEACLADALFGADRSHMPQMEWLGQVLLTVDVLKEGDLVEVAVFGQPFRQTRMKRVLLSLALWHKQHRSRAEKMQHLEDFLKRPLLDPDFV